MTPSRPLVSLSAQTATFLRELAWSLRHAKLSWLLVRADQIELRRQNRIVLLNSFLSVFLQVVLLGVIYSNLFQQDLTDYLPYFGISLAVWQNITMFVGKSGAYNDSANRIASFPDVSPLIIHVSGLIESLLHLMTTTAAALCAATLFSPNALLHVHFGLLLMGALMVQAFLFFSGILLSFFLDRIRILRAMLPQIFFLLFLISPILWKKELLTSHQWLVTYNPVFHLIEIVRDPFLAGSVPLKSTLVVAGLTLCMMLISPFFYHLNRRLIWFRWVA